MLFSSEAYDIVDSIQRQQYPPSAAAGAMIGAIDHWAFGVARYAIMADRPSKHTDATNVGDWLIPTVPGLDP